MEKPVSEGVITDFLSDANGVTFHRFLIVVWTIVLGLIFISAGTYIGFKIPERQTNPADNP